MFIPGQSLKSVIIFQIISPAMQSNTVGDVNDLQLTFKNFPLYVFLEGDGLYDNDHVDVLFLDPGG